MFDFEMNRREDSPALAIHEYEGARRTPTARQLRGAGSFEEQQRILSPGNPGVQVPRPLPQPTQKPEEETVDITVVDNEDLVGMVGARVHQGEVKDFRTAADMVDRILARAAGKKIRWLRINDHGAPGMQGIGDDIAAEGYFPEVMAELGRLKGHFAADGKVFLQGCSVGQGPEGVRLLAQLASLWGVPVEASEIVQHVIPRGLQGPTVECSPEAGDRWLMEQSGQWNGGPDAQPDCTRGSGQDRNFMHDMAEGLLGAELIVEKNLRKVPKYINSAANWARKKMPKFW